MLNTQTSRMVDLYLEEASAPMFLAGHFQSPPSNFHTAEKVTIDVIRDDEDVAIVVQDISTGARANESNLYVNKGYTPPVFDEMAAISAYDQMNRRPGANPLEDPHFYANAVEEAFRLFHKLERKIRRAVEFMASQVLQTGTLALPLSDGSVGYSETFGAKASHFPTAATAWGTGGATPIDDLEALATTLRRDGKRRPHRLIFGMRAFRDFVETAEVQARLDNREMHIGSVAPAVRGEGATFQGHVWLGHYRFEMWTYDGFFKHPATGVQTSYVGDDAVIMMSDDARLDLTFGELPRLKQPDAQAALFLPGRISGGEQGLDLSTNAWFTPDGKHLMVSAGTRPLTIPTAIDTFGTLTTR